MTESILVIGGSGFIGTNLVEAILASGYTVSTIDTSPPLIPTHLPFWKQVSILDSTALTAAMIEISPSVVVHLAARTDLDGAAVEDYAANTIGVANVLNAVRAASSVRRLVVASTMLVCRLGYQPKNDIDYCPNTIYGQSKVETERLVREATNLPPWVIIRPTTIWGPWHVRLRDQFLQRVASGLYVHPTRDCRRSYGYVENVAYQITRLIEAAVATVAGQTFYVGDEPVSLSAYVDSFSQQLRGKPVKRVPYRLLKAAALCGDAFVKMGWRSTPLTSYRLSNMTADHILDMTATLAVTGAGPYSLDQGVKRTCTWMESSLRMSKRDVAD